MAHVFVPDQSRSIRRFLVGNVSAGQGVASRRLPKTRTWMFGQGAVDPSESYFLLVDFWMRDTPQIPVGLFKGDFFEGGFLPWQTHY